MLCPLRPNVFGIVLFKSIFFCLITSDYETCQYMQTKSNVVNYCLPARMSNVSSIQRTPHRCLYTFLRSHVMHLAIARHVHVPPF